MLWLGLQDLQNKGLILRATDRYTLTLTASQAFADMPADTVSVEKGIMVRELGGTTELPVLLYDRAAYQAQPNTAEEGRPCYCYPEAVSGGTWRLYFWPVPTADWLTVIVPRGKQMRDITTGNINVDLDPKWLRTIVDMIGRDFAMHFGSPTKAAQMQSLLSQHMAEAMGDESTRGDTQFIVPSTPWD
jgi:hypothetical protein